jgi:hypothetical protein
MAGDKSDNSDSELLEVAKRLAQAERSKDIATLKDLIADDYIGVGAGGELLTKEIVLERFSNPALELDRHEVSDVQVRVVEPFGLIVGIVVLRGTLEGQSFEGRFRFMDVAAKRLGQWQVVASQLTVMA